MGSTEPRWRFITVHSVSDDRGTLAAIQAPDHIPFLPHRVFYVYGIPEGTARGAHAHREQHQCLVCLTGSMDVELDDGRQRGRYHLNSPGQALYLPPLTWIRMTNIAAGATYFVLASAAYDEADYLRDYDDFVRATRS